MTKIRFSAYLDVDELPLAFIQSRHQFISITRYQDGIAWREHRTAKAAIQQARRDRGIAASFNPFNRLPRWEPLADSLS